MRKFFINGKLLQEDMLRTHHFLQTSQMAADTVNFRVRESGEPGANFTIC